MYLQVVYRGFGTAPAKRYTVEFVALGEFKACELYSGVGQGLKRRCLR